MLLQLIMVSVLISIIHQVRSQFYTDHSICRVFLIMNLIVLVLSLFLGHPIDLKSLSIFRIVPFHSVTFLLLTFVFSFHQATFSSFEADSMILTFLLTLSKFLRSSFIVLIFQLLKDPHSNPISFSSVIMLILLI